MDLSKELSEKLGLMEFYSVKLTSDDVLKVIREYTRPEYQEMVKIAFDSLLKETRELSSELTLIREKIILLQNN